MLELEIVTDRGIHEAYDFCGPVLGKGSFATVLRVRDRMSGSEYAVKQVRLAHACACMLSYVCCCLGWYGSLQQWWDKQTLSTLRPQLRSAVDLPCTKRTQYSTQLHTDVPSWRACFCFFFLPRLLFRSKPLCLFVRKPRSKSPQIDLDAIKDSPSSLRMIERECRTMMSLSHPNIVRLQEVYRPRSGDRLYMVLDRLEGGSVDGLWRKQGKLSEDHAAHIILQVVSAVRYCHDRGIAVRLGPYSCI